MTSSAPLHEYSVVFTDRALNHMSPAFQAVMRGISATLRQVYNADAVALVPGGGSFGMEAVARQFATGRRCLVLRNGWFSYRWSQIFEMGSIPSAVTVLKAHPESADVQAQWAPPALDEVLDCIRRERPELVFAPHVETASGLLLPEDYLRAVAEAVHAVGGLFVLDCVASGALWLDMQAIGIDVLISAPQKGWSAPSSCALIMLSAAAHERLAQTRSTSFAADLQRWRQIMQTYEQGAHAYHATLPTDALAALYRAMQETEQAGFALMRTRQLELGQAVRNLLLTRGLMPVAAEGYAAPGVIVCHTRDDGLHSGRRFIDVGLQCAAGVPLMCDEPAGFKTFRIGLFGLDKLQNIERTVGRLADGFDQLGLMSVAGT